MDMHLYIYSDESGVLDKYHNDYYVFGGVVFLSKDEKDNYARKYIAAEKNVRLSEELDDRQEVKGSVIQPKSKNKLYRCMRDAERFGAVVAQKKLDDMLFLNAHKKSRQRYLDWLYKMAVKTKLQKLIKDGIIIPDQVDAIDFYVDEHSTATNGYYELKESLEKEFQRGIWVYKYMTYHKPLFPRLRSTCVSFRDSSATSLVRSADIIANHIYFYANRNDGRITEEDKLSIYYHP